MQILIVAIAIAAATAYAAWRIYQVMSNPRYKCKGCPLEEHCTRTENCMN